MSLNPEMISKEEAARQVHSMITRLAWLHYAFARTLMKELGEEKGKALSKKAVALYGELVGKGAQAKTKAKGLPLTRENYSEDLPSLGWGHSETVEVEGEKRRRVYTCHLAKIWKELGAPEVGRLYCFVDQAKYEAYNPELVCVHVKNVLDGDPYCELAVRSKKK
jgi:predicted hydrocarbon binding protein